MQGVPPTHPSCWLFNPSARCHFALQESPHALKVHCHGDFAVCRPKLLKRLTKNPFFNVKSLLEHEENKK